MPTWQELVADKQKRQKASIPKDWLVTPPPEDRLDVSSFPQECNLLTPFEFEITETTDVGVVLSKLASGKWSSVDVTRAFYKRAIIAQQAVNCLTEIFVDRALARAAECDEYLKKNGKPMGALHGLPISLKDQIKLKDIETTMGYVSWIGDYSDRDATLVTILYEAGAVPFVRTNVPQTLMWPETFNNIFGRTLNPYNRKLTSGGSSGGEGALIAMKGSPLGVGLILRSIRIPSAFCGIYSLRPSYNRVPYEGASNSMEGQDSIPSVLGPLSASISGVKAFMKAVIDLQPWKKDPLAVRKPWDEDAYRLKEHGEGKDLCFAIMWDNGYTKPTPPIRRSLEIAKKAFEAKGIKVVDWPSGFDYGQMTTAVKRTWAAGSQEDYAATVARTGEPVLRTMALDGVSSGLEWVSPAEPLSAYGLWQVQKRRAVLRKEHLDLWTSTQTLTGTGRPIDALITPVAPYASVPHGKNADVSYTMVWNGLDYPASVFPVSKVDPTLDVKQPRSEFLSKADEYFHNLYDPAVWQNAPTCLQLVGQTLEEEAVIAMTEIADAAIKAYGPKQSKL